MNQKTYIFANTKTWNAEHVHEAIHTLPGEWICAYNREDLNLHNIKAIGPRYIFFPHWSWIVPKDILCAAECVCFHMTDVPYGRGGSPLQNLIARGHKTTKLTALRMTEDLDAGPIYMKRDLDLSGSAQEIFERAAPIILDMIQEIVKKEPKPIQQSGKATFFKRRTPGMSALPKGGSLEALYDHIRMLDAETYPRAFVEHGDFVLAFSGAQLEGEDIKAKVTIRRRYENT
jgi:methionyl-tRNA formyltransferase